jgi:hypothetical protein
MTMEHVRPVKVDASIASVPITHVMDAIQIILILTMEHVYAKKDFMKKVMIAHPAYNTVKNVVMQLTAKIAFHPILISQIYVKHVMTKWLILIQLTISATHAAILLIFV